MFIFLGAVYDFYGGYSGVYAGGMLVQTYPGGPLVPAVPVPVPVQALDWYGRGSSGASSSPGSPAQGELGFYYALGYPTAAQADASAANNEPGASNSRRNSLESCQVSYPIRFH